MCFGEDALRYVCTGKRNVFGHEQTELGNSPHYAAGLEQTTHYERDNRQRQAPNQEAEAPVESRERGAEEPI